MSILLTNNPVVTEGGVVKNLFAGFEPVEFIFKREDAQISGVGLGIDNNLLINTTSDLSGYLNVGDFVYVNSQGLTFEYDSVGEIIAITVSTITISVDFIEGTSNGYINYYKNYYLEVEIVNVNNSAVKVLPFSLIDDGDSAGNITIDVSIVNDLNIQFFEYLRQEMTASRTLFKIQYRQVWDINTDSYIVVDDEIILAYATQQPEIETFINELDNPKLWKGYPFGVILAHSDENSDNNGLNFSYDELDINKSTLVSGNGLGSLQASDEGFLFIDIDKGTTYNADTEYIRLIGVYSGLRFFDSTFFDPAFFNA